MAVFPALHAAIGDVVPEADRPRAFGPAAAPGPGRGWSTVLGDRPFVALVALSVLFLTVVFQFQVAAPIAMLGSGLRPAQIGRVLAVNGQLIGALQPFAVRALAGRDRGRVLALGTLLVGAGYGGYAQRRCSAGALPPAPWSLRATSPSARRAGRGRGRASSRSVSSRRSPGARSR